MRPGLASVFAVGWLVAGATALTASETGPVIVIPGRAGVPIMMDGRDVSYSVIEGDWGLGRPSNIAPRVIYRYGPPVRFGPGSASYFPSIGQPPRVGRKEVDMPSTNPEPAEGYIRSWGVQSDPTPATSPSAYETPPVIVAPQDFRRQQRRP
jgi:hypothetical protein